MFTASLRNATVYTELTNRHIAIGKRNRFVINTEANMLRADQTFCELHLSNTCVYGRRVCMCVRACLRARVRVPSRHVLILAAQPETSNAITSTVITLC